MKCHGDSDSDSTNTVHVVWVPTVVSVTYTCLRYLLFLPPLVHPDNPRMYPTHVSGVVDLSPYTPVNSVIIGENNR